jgi:uncharacterized membrane protein YvlD (DUF360 family)
MMSRMRGVLLGLCKGLLIWTAQALVLLLLAALLPSVRLGDLATAYLAIAVIGLANAVAWPVLVDVAIRLHPVLFPVLSFALNGGLVLATARRLVPGLEIDGILAAVGISLVLTGSAIFLGSLLSIQDDRAYERFAVRPLRRRFARGAGRAPEDAAPGLFFLEIDGLSVPALRHALEAGYMPTLARWLASGSHHLLEWEPDLSSQTSASQAGILQGDNAGIPAFRWYEKESARLMVSNDVRDCIEIERRASDGRGLLAEGGASRGNLLSGDAPDSLFTVSTVLHPSRARSLRYFLFYANPYTVARTVALFGADVVKEVVAAWRQRLRDERPRVHRGGVYPLLRAATTSFLRELSTYTLTGDLLRGVPVAYTTYVAYDEVAHHSGILRPDALAVLRDLDRDIGRLERVAAHAPRRYHFVVLSDHGQSQGATFRQRYGLTLEGLVERALGAPRSVGGDMGADEHWGTVNAVLTDALRHDERAGRVIGRAFGSRVEDGQVRLGPEAERARRSAERPPAAAPEVVVLASGNLGLLYFPALPGRVTLEQLGANFPALVPTLAAHPGIAFVLVHSEQSGAVVIGAEGTNYLEEERVEGTDPLTPFGATAGRHLLRHSRFANAPDLLVNGAYDPATEGVAAFEELVGSHGGLGGPQTRPFVLHPAELDAGTEPVIGAEALHRLLQRWRASCVVRG